MSTMGLGLDEINALLRKSSEEYHVKTQVVAKRRIAFQNVKTLRAVEKYVFYTPAILYLWGRFSDTPLTDILTHVDVPILWHRFDKPLFSGLATPLDASWNQILWACPRDKWDAFSEAVLETAQLDLAAHTIYTYTLHTIDVFDPISVDRERLVIPDRTDRIVAHVFAVSTNKFQLELRKPKTGTTPAVVRLPPAPEFVRAAERFFATPFASEADALRRFKLITAAMDDGALDEMYAEFRKKRRRS
jgi:hypothetical protein